MYLCPSTMCLDFNNLEKSVKELDEAGTDIFHNDVMDGNFVPNITLGLNDIKTIRNATNKPIDAHLMINNPDNKVDWFINLGVDIIYIHPEAGGNTVETLKHIKDKNCKAGIAINPETSIEEVKHMFDICDYVMIMSVHPGFAGQKFIEDVMIKIKELGELKNNYKFKLMLDGACSPEKIKECSKLGVDGFVLGTSALFNKDDSYKNIMNNLRKL